MTANIRTELGRVTQTVRDEFDSMNQDIKFLDQLDLLNAAGLQNWKPKLSALFGQYGMTLEERIKLFDGKNR
ncbi:hypothetical protein FACS189443_2780 [Planctomycetales bacterium]|nr:hypothetical protein FACS189443_2780 [Planctomycetales bacterium]